MFPNRYFPFRLLSSFLLYSDLTSTLISFVRILLFRNQWVRLGLRFCIWMPLSFTLLTPHYSARNHRQIALAEHAQTAPDAPRDQFMAVLWSPVLAPKHTAVCNSLSKHKEGSRRNAIDLLCFWYVRPFL
jgi:hypothetical protein